MTTNQTIDGVPRELLEALVQIHPSDTRYRFAKEELRALLEPADHVHEWDINAEGTATVCHCGARSSDEPAAQPQGEPVAYLDIGAGGYVDLGTDQPLEALEKLPYGRHMLGIIGTYGADGWQPIVKHPTTEIEPVAYAVLADNGDIRVWSRSPEVVEIICGQGLTPVQLYAEQPAPVAVVKTCCGSCPGGCTIGNKP